MLFDARDAAQILCGKLQERIDQLEAKLHDTETRENQVLKKNRRILEELIGNEEMTKHPKSKFTSKGFDFGYYTHQYINKKGNIYFFCYEYGYLPLEGEWYLIVKRKS